MLPTLRRCLSTHPHLTHQLAPFFTQHRTFSAAREFVVTVVTGDERGAGTNATVHFNIHGSKGDLGDTVLDPKIGFQRNNAPETFELASHSDLGEINEITIGHDESGVGAGWYVDHIELTVKPQPPQLPTPHTHVIPVQRWLGKSDSGGMSGPPTIRLPIHPTTIGTAKKAAKVRANAAPFLKLSASASAIPHPNKISKGGKAVVQKDHGHAGDDAFAMGGRAIALADGVYAWRERGIDSGQYSQFLTQAVVRNHLSHPHRTPQQLMEVAFEAAKASEVKGSCTLVVLRLDALKSVLHGAILGDSGFLVVRGLGSGAGGRIIYRSPHHEHFFGYPYQLGHHPESDSPADAVIVNVAVSEGDVLVVASDGLFDNLTDEQIVEHLAANVRNSSCDCFAAAHAMAASAFHISQDTRATTPYSMAASEEFNCIVDGGKPDDITVLVAEVRAFFED